MKNSGCTIKQVLDEFNFEVLILEKKDLEKPILHAELTRPGLELIGYYDYTDNCRPVIIGLKEITYLEKMDEENQRKAFDFLTQSGIPYILISRNLECPKILKEICEKKKFPLFRDGDTTSHLINRIMTYCNELLAPQELYHGTLLEVFGVGVMITGKSGIGKSESALELIKKGHRLVADDSILVYKMHNKLYGKAPTHLQNLLEVRGIGVIDISIMFGITSIVESKRIDYVVELISGEESANLDRLSTKQEHITIMDKDIPSVKIPVVAGRMIADLIEVGITNLRLKSKGFDATKKLVDKFDKLVDKGGE